VQPTSTTTQCPHCGTTLELRVRIEASVAPALRIEFQDADELRTWLEASRLTVDQFRHLPVYTWHASQLAPLVDEIEARDATPSRATGAARPA
jgi:hypothetical protein